MEQEKDNIENVQDICFKDLWIWEKTIHVSELYHVFRDVVGTASFSLPNNTNCMCSQRGKSLHFTSAHTMFAPLKSQAWDC